LVALGLLAAVIGAFAGIVAWAHGKGYRSGPGLNATVVRFSVTGPAADRVRVSYDDRRGATKLDGEAELPFVATVGLDSSLGQYYVIHAVVLKGGSITCQVRIGSVVKDGHAAGAGQACSATLSYLARGGGGWY